MLINGREQILEKKDNSAEEIVKFLRFMPCALEAGDVVDFCSLAQYYAIKTPSSFKTGYLKSLFGVDTNSPDRSISQALCLPVTVYELIENISSSPPNMESVRFFLVDCRPADQYNYGHLPTAFHLDSNLMLQEPGAFATAVCGLLRAQRNAIQVNSDAGGEHLCFMGSGRLDEDQYMHMVVASFLQKNTVYVSVLTGGYASIHDFFGQQTNAYLKDHDQMRCLMCIGPSSSYSDHKNNDRANQISNSNSTEQISHAASTSSLKSQPSIDLFSKLSSVMKSKSQEVKGKFMDYIVNPYTVHQQGPSTNVPIEKHVSKTEKNGKRYRNVAPVFSIDEDNTDLVDYNNPNTNHEEEEEEEVRETVNLQNYTKNPDVITALKCQEVQMNGYMFDSHLILTKTHLVVLRDLDKKGTAEIIVQRPLSNIVKITAKKRHRDLITFKYGVPDGEELLITDMDRFLIPNASEATALVSKQIIQQLDNSKKDESK